MPKTSFKTREDLSRKARDLLRGGHAPEDVARLLNVSLRTIQRWKRKQEGKVLAGTFQSAPMQQESPVNDIDHVPTDEDIQKRIQSLTGLSLHTLESILRSPDTRTADRLRACQLVLNSSGHTDPSVSVPSKAIDLLFRLGYEVTDPNLPPEEKTERSKGLSDEVAEWVKEKILFGNF